MATLAKFLTVIVVTAAIPAWSASFDVQAKVVYVSDGDTVTILTAEHQQLKVRLASIDAPETSHENHESGRIGQPFSANSTQHLAGLIKGKMVQAHCFEQDKYARNVCDLFIDDHRSVNQEMVRAGWAWANVSYRGRYLRDKSLLAIEAKARADHSGLWAGRNPVEPWSWRDVCWQQGQCQ